MKKSVLILLLAWVAIYAGNHLLFKSVRSNNGIETALRSQPDPLSELDSWGPYLPGVRANDDQDLNGLASNAGRKAEGNRSSDKQIAESLRASQSSEEKLAAKIPPTPTKKRDVLDSVSSALDRQSDVPQNVVAEQKGKILGQHKTRFAHAARSRSKVHPSGRSSPEEAWSPAPLPKTRRFTENKPVEVWPPGPAPRRWRSGMFMFAPPDF